MNNLKPKSKVNLLILIVCLMAGMSVTQTLVMLIYLAHSGGLFLDSFAGVIGSACAYLLYCAVMSNIQRNSGYV